MEYIVDKEKSLLTIIFNRIVLNHLKAKCDDNLYFIQSLHNYRYFTLVKSDTGYRIRRFPKMKKTYQINISHRLNILDQFDLMNCTYFMKKNGFIKVKI